ncbi:MAG: hypothetical protein FWF41_05410 [Betaproteobacteria bacterium]|nr:hypothetical protein [Betaproteobacteria bacterium]
MEENDANNLEAFARAVEDMFVAVTGTICATSSPSKVLKNLIAAQAAMDKSYGKNAWRNKTRHQPAIPGRNAREPYLGWS